MKLNVCFHNHTEVITGLLLICFFNTNAEVSTAYDFISSPSIHPGEILSKAPFRKSSTSTKSQIPIGKSKKVKQKQHDSYTPSFTSLQPSYTLKEISTRGPSDTPSSSSGLSGNISTKPSVLSSKSQTSEPSWSPINIIHDEPSIYPMEKNVGYPSKIPMNSLGEEFSMNPTLTKAKYLSSLPTKTSSGIPSSNLNRNPSQRPSNIVTTNHTDKSLKGKSPSLNPTNDLTVKPSEKFTSSEIEYPSIYPSYKIDEKPTNGVSKSSSNKNPTDKPTKQEHSMPYVHMTLPPSVTLFSFNPSEAKLTSGDNHIIDKKKTSSSDISKESKHKKGSHLKRIAAVICSIGGAFLFVSIALVEKRRRSKKQIKIMADKKSDSSWNTDFSDPQSNQIIFSPDMNDDNCSSLCSSVALSYNFSQCHSEDKSCDDERFDCIWRGVEGHFSVRPVANVTNIKLEGGNVESNDFSIGDHTLKDDVEGYSCHSECFC